MPDASSTHKRLEVSIIGGGVCGLTCAVALQRAGVHVQIFEAAVRLLPLLSSIPKTTIVAIDGFRRDWCRHWSWSVVIYILLHDVRWNNLAFVTMITRSQCRAGSPHNRRVRRDIEEDKSERG